MVRTAIAALLLAAASPSFAQASSDAPLPDPNDQSDTFTVALGGAWLPDYEGSDDYEASPFGAVRARVNGISLFTRGTHLYVDLIRRPAEGLDIDLGPILGVRRERVTKVEDPFVRLFGKRNTAIEVGGFVGITGHGLTNPYDSLSLRLDAMHDVGNAHESTIISPSVDFGTPLSRRTYLGLSASAEWVSNDYADYYYATPATLFDGSVVPGYNPGGGKKNWRLGALLNQSLTGDLTGGLSLFGAGDYSRIVGSIGNSPIVDLRGSKSQWRVAAGLAYTW